MGLITPDYGLLFWMALSFGILLFILKKFAWKTILKSIKDREEFITKSLRDADTARNELANLENRNIELLAKANAERSDIISQANKARDKILQQAQLTAQDEAKKVLDQAREVIKREKESAQLEIKAYASQIVMLAAERILRKELKDKVVYEEQIDSIIQELSSQN
ncbi:MAG: F0F1 ATP synthase subunit B [Bacteroidales bacterium]|nr:F0F1 ATP synthase subunit B [Bacteroidales bacterium]MDD3890691.1 F0F1 ATP synthase subunit B [Bacteroidales bacterium]